MSYHIQENNFLINRSFGCVASVKPPSADESGEIHNSQLCK